MQWFVQRRSANSHLNELYSRITLMKRHIHLFHNPVFYCNTLKLSKCSRNVDMYKSTFTYLHWTDFKRRKTTSSLLLTSAYQSINMAINNRNNRTLWVGTIQMSNVWVIWPNIQFVTLTSYITSHSSKCTAAAGNSQHLTNWNPAYVAPAALGAQPRNRHPLPHWVQHAGAG